METFECGMNNSHCIKVIRIGVPRDLSVLVQEMGRTGRENDGKFPHYFFEFLRPATISIVINFEDAEVLTAIELEKTSDYAHRPTQCHLSMDTHRRL